MTPSQKPEPKSGMLLTEEEIREAARLAGIDADKVVGYPSGMEPFELAFARRIEAAVLTKWAGMFGDRGDDTAAEWLAMGAAEAEKESNGD